MADLSELRRRLVDKAMEEDEAPPTDASLHLLVSRITAGAASERVDLDARIAPPRGAARRWVALAVVVTTAAGVAWWLSRPSPRAPDAEGPAPVVAPSAAPSPASAPPAASSHGVAAPADEPPVERLLDEAEAALETGDPDRAMRLLQRHAERAPLHPQAERRMALRILGLCALRRDTDAQAEARAFLGRDPDARWREKIARSCAAQ